MDRNNLDYRPLLDKLLALGDRHRESGYDMAGQDLRAALFLLGWFQRIRRTVQAVRILTDAGFINEAAPLTRTLVEYGVAVKLVAHEPYKGVDIYIHKMQKTIRDWVRVAAATGDSTELPHDMQTILTWETDPESVSLDRLLHFKHLCEESNEMDFYRYWWNTLPFCHASYEGSMAYVSPSHEILDQAADGGVVNPLGVSATVLFMACDIVNALIPASPWRTELAVIERQLYPEGL